MPDNDVYLDTVARMEPDIAMVDQGGALASIAISLRRIADALERCTSAQGLFALIAEIKPMIDGAEGSENDAA